MRRMGILIALVLVTGTTSALAAGAKPATKPANRAAKPAQAAKRPAPAKNPNMVAPRIPGLTQEASTAVGRLGYCVEDLTAEQRDKAIPIFKEFGERNEAMVKARRAEHQATLDYALRTRTQIDMKATGIRDALRDRQQQQLEVKYFDRVGTEVLTPEQRVKWDGFRLYLVAGFQLGMMGLKKDQIEGLRTAVTEPVARDLAPLPDEDGYQFFQRRVMEVKARAAEKYFDAKQKKKLAESNEKIAERNRQVDELVAKEAAAKGAE